MIATDSGLGHSSAILGVAHVSHLRPFQRSNSVVPEEGGVTVGTDAVLTLRLDGQVTAEANRDVEVQLVELMNRHERAIYTFVLFLVKDADVALDCTQDTFLRAYENLRRKKPVNTSWLHTVARNCVMDVFRQKKRVERDREKLEKMTVEDSTHQSLAVQTVMDQLQPLDREVLYLFDVVGFKTDEIGAMFGVRGSAIRQRLTRARERFRALYREQV